jgi:5-methylcytosine-specific restriction endonuclease McrA
MKCSQCQTEILKPGNKFCNSSCAASFNNKGLRRHSKPDSPHSTVKPCKTCSKETSRKVYCSDECNPKRLKLSPEEKQARHSAMHREAWQRYMAKLKDQTPDGVNIKELQEIYLNCPIGHEVDHIIPVSKGGLHCPSNLQYLTISENRKKSNKI